jgi:hypothetical protein
MPDRRRSSVSAAWVGGLRLRRCHRSIVQPRSDLHPDLCRRHRAGQADIGVRRRGRDRSSIHDWIALKYARRYPEHVRGVVAVGLFGPETRPRASGCGRRMHPGSASAQNGLESSQRSFITTV